MKAGDFVLVTSNMIELVKKYKEIGGCLGACSNTGDVNTRFIGVGSCCPFVMENCKTNFSCSGVPIRDNMYKGRDVFTLGKIMIDEFLQIFDNVVREDIEED